MNTLSPLDDSEREHTVGLTTTVPVEIILAAGHRPLDLNNVFITSGQASRLVEEAEHEGFPRNACAWNKGIFATACRLGLKRMVGVTQGDCANTHAMMEMLRERNVDVIPFAFPYQPDDTELLDLSLRRFANALGTTLPNAEMWKTRMDPIRALAHEIDDLCWRDGRVSSSEQHLWMITCSDFDGDPDEYRRRAEDFLANARQRCPHSSGLRLALLGIPPICEGLFEFLETCGAHVVFNEVPRQFTMPAHTKSLREQYACYTYPYDIFVRLADIRREIARRRVDGVIHYVQSFCFRQVQDAILRRTITTPILTLEGDRPGPLDMRTETRIEAFLEMLRENDTFANELPSS